MVVGFDVCHDSKNKQRSYGAMVASLNKQLTRYYSTVSSHSTGEELSNDISLNVISTYIVKILNSECTCAVLSFSGYNTTVGLSVKG